MTTSRSFALATCLVCFSCTVNEWCTHFKYDSFIFYLFIYFLHNCLFASVALAGPLAIIILPVANLYESL